MESEIETPGHPRSALPGFCVGVMAYNTLSVVEGARCTTRRSRIPVAEIAQLLVEIVRHIPLAMIKKLIDRGNSRRVVDALIQR